MINGSLSSLNENIAEPVRRTLSIMNSTREDAQTNYNNNTNYSSSTFNETASVQLPSTMRVCLWLICILGIALNAIVFKRNNYSRKRQNSTVRNSLQLLCFMAIADTISLAALLLALSTQYLGIENYIVVAAICKIDLFLIHSASAFSIWCWLVLSAIRYLAVYRPYSHLKLNNGPIFVTLLIFVICCLLELWILFDVTYIQEVKICGETLPDKWSKSLQLAEIIWSYFLPLTLITVLDFKVLCCHSMWSYERKETSSTPIFPTSESTYNNNDNNETQTLKKGPKKFYEDFSPFKNAHKESLVVPPFSENKDIAILATPRVNVQRIDCPFRHNSKRRIQQIRILRRCLCISILDLGMNLPNYLVRLYLTLVTDEDLEEINNTKIFLWLQDISQLLYFAQVAISAVILLSMTL